MAKISVVFRGRTGKDGTAPIELVIYHKGKHTYINLGITISPDQWNGCYDEYFTTLEEACIKIGELCGKKVDTVSDIEEALTDYSESHNDMYLQFIEYTVIDD